MEDRLSISVKTEHERVLAPLSNEIKDERDDREVDGCESGGRVSPRRRRRHDTVGLLGNILSCF